MATDVDVQYFSHLNGLTLGNNWGDLIRLLDKALVTGIDFTQITAASIDAQGDVHITLYAAHNAMLLQVVELTGFAPASLNQKYRIKGVPSTTELILKPHTVIAETSITTVGAGKLASLGYDIIFRDTNNVKRVYRAKNPTAQHPFIRVDESLTSPDGTTGVYTSTYAKSAMVGLIENMSHIDDYLDPNKMQLPLDTSDFAKNWKINGTGTNVIRGWSKWYWATASDAAITGMTEASAPANLNRSFTLIGDENAFYFLNARTTTGFYKLLSGAGIFPASSETLQHPWFLMTLLRNESASNSINGPYALTDNAVNSKFIVNSSASIPVISSHIGCTPIQPGYNSGKDVKFNGGNIGALEIPFYDDLSVLRGVLPIVAFSGKSYGAISATTPILSNNSMYIYDALTPAGNGSGGGIYFYLGELE